MYGMGSPWHKVTGTCHYMMALRLHVYRRRGVGECIAALLASTANVVM